MTEEHQDNEQDVSCSFCGKHRNEVTNLIAGPIFEGRNLYICELCVDKCHSILTEDDDAYNEPVKERPRTKIYTPEQIKEHLDQFVVGQDKAKIAMSVAIYNHYKRIRNKSNVVLDKSNMLLIGPSGSGKTHTVKTIASMFDLPYVIADATSITEAGYSGDDVDSMIVRLINSADGDIELAQQGIVFIDEIDKKGKKSESSTVGRDISGEGVQQALLKLIEGTTLDISLDDELVEFDTTNILFIFSGAFVGLTDIIQKNRSKTSIGFGANIQAETAGLLKDVNSQDLIKYGMIPEFLGRCPVTVVFDDLTVDTLVQILKEPKNSIVSQFQTLFKMDGVRLEFDDEYLKTVATECISQKLGARGLRTIIERHLQETQFMLPRLSKEGINKITVDATGVIKHTKRVKRRMSGSK